MARVLLDTDLGMGQPGSDIDDGFALAFAVAEPEITLELVTTVNGNTDVDTASRLTVGLLERLGRADVPVLRGASAPLVRASPRSPDGTAPYWPPGTRQGSGRGGTHAALGLVDRVLAEPGELTVVAIGPLTNVALACALEPAFASSVREIMVMGGVFLGQTNVGAMPGEFNFWVDPEAAAIVLASGAPLRLVGLDVTRLVRLDTADADRLAGGQGRFGAFAGECTRQWIAHLNRTVPGSGHDLGSCALHDPLAIACVTEPDLVSWADAAVRVETGSDTTRGVAVADLLTTDQPPVPNCRIAVEVDVARFRDLLLTRLAALP